MVPRKQHITLLVYAKLPLKPCNLPTLEKAKVRSCFSAPAGQARSEVLRQTDASLSPRQLQSSDLLNTFDQVQILPHLSAPCQSHPLPHPVPHLVQAIRAPLLWTSHFRDVFAAVSV